VNYLVGLTGGIGCGKSTVAGLFAGHGVRIIDTDLISHHLTQADGEAMPAIRAEFGARFIDNLGALDRSRMRELVFAEPTARKRLEAILHPLILAHARQQALVATDAPYSLVVVPLLFESGHYAGWLQRVIAVDCPEALQVARTMQRSGMDEATVRAIMAQQLSRSERLQRADEIIRNEGSLDDLSRQVFDMHQRLSGLAAESI
jgi:dephospho-CoA kinase